MRRTIIATSLLALGVGGAFAQGQAEEDANVIVLDTIKVTTANRTPTEADKTGSKVERVTQQEIEQKSLPTVADYLNRVPGVTLPTNGGIGGITNIFVRGLPARYVKTQFNGIDISDPSNTQVATHYDHLLAAGVSGIEVLKGSQSTLYGSNAIAGLVDISTFGEAKDGIQHTVEVEGGSFGTARGRYGFAAAKGDSRIAANASAFHTDGISSAAGFPEKDGYDNVTFDLNVEHRISEAFSVFGSAIYYDARSDFDGTGADNLLYRNINKTMAGRAGFNLDLMDGRLKNTVSLQGFKVDRETVGQDTINLGRRQKIDYAGSFEFSDRILLQYGADHERQTADISTPWGGLSASHNLTGYWAQTIVEPLDNLVLTAGVRHDVHSEFGGHTTWRGTASYLFDSTGTRIHSSYATGFRAPSLYELYDPSSGNPALKPETSRSFDIGVEQSMLGGDLKAGLAYFNLDVDNLIAWVETDPVFWTGEYRQVLGRSRSHGIEASFTYAVTPWLDLGGSYTYTNSRDADGNQLVRVPKHAVVLAALVRPAEKWTVGADVKFVAGAVDGYPTGTPLKDYVLLNAKVAYQLTDTMEVYARGENLLDQKYEVVRGYGTPGISAYAGFRAKF